MLKLAEIFQSRMILQRGKSIRIWGNSSEEGVLKIMLNGEMIVSEKIKAGNFQVWLPPQDIILSAEMKVCLNEQEILFEDVDFGEVWIAGGQSNMEFPLVCDRDYEREKSTMQDSHFRYFEVGKYAFEGEREEGLKDGSNWNIWLLAEKTKLPQFSAIGSYFAKELRGQMQIPVGIISCNWGGTTAAAWLDEKYLSEEKELQVYLDEYKKQTEKLNVDKYMEQNRNVRKQAGSAEVQKRQLAVMKQEMMKKPGKMQLLLAKLYSRGLKSGPHDENRPAGLYHTMLQKICGYGCAGIIWYQGESDVRHADIYDRLFSAVIRCWRRDWGEELPFLFVQLAPFEAWMASTGERFPKLREQQRKVAKTLQCVWMISSMDVGSRYDIHPKEKKLIGNRLAALALHCVYGYEISCFSPEISTVDRKGNIMYLNLEHAEEGLIETGEWKNLIQLWTKEKKISFQAELQPGRIVLYLPEEYVKTTVWLSFAYQPYLKMTLKNKAGFVAMPFAPVKIEA